MIEVKNLDKYFDENKILSDLSITVPTGSIYGLVGPNGSGKTTLIKNLTGILKPEKGEILFDGKSVYENPKIKEKFAVILDDWYHFPQASIKDMKNFYKGIYPSFSEERYEKLKDIFCIPETKLIRKLSKGMQKQVAFWICISVMPKYLILDEPVDGLDPVMRRQIWSLIMQDVSERQTTVLVSSHNLRELEDVCDHVGILDKGHVLIERSLQDLQDNMVKMQVVFKEDINELPNDILPLHVSKVGRVYTLIMRMNEQEAKRRLEIYNPLVLDAIPLTLEEIFIYELGGESYAVKEIAF